MLLNSVASYAHFFTIEEWNNFDSKSQNKQTIGLFSDVHRSDAINSKSIKKQRDELVDLAKKLNAIVIVEDSLIYGDDLIYSSSINMHQGTFPEDKLKKIEIETPLHGIHSLCKIKGVTSKNIEYRFSSFRPLDVYYNFFQNKKYQIKNSYKDGTLFEQYYKDRIDQLEQLIEVPLKPIFDLFKNSKEKLGDFLKRKDLPVIKNIDEIFRKVEKKWDIDSIGYAGKISILLTNYAAAFLDMEIMHAIATYDHQLLFICAGDMHIQEIKKALTQIGYNQKNQKGDSLKLLQGKKYSEPMALDINKTVAHFSFPKDVATYNPHSFPETIFKITQNALQPINLLNVW